MPSQTAREILASALKRKEELKKESDALDKLIAAYREILDLPDQSEEPTLDFRPRPGSRKAQSDYVARLLRECRQLILDAGRPLKRSELVRLLERKGYPVDGSDKSKVLGTNIWRSGLFRHIDGYGYWPKDAPMPAPP
jgi:hypothetical protein